MSGIGSAMTSGRWHKKGTHMVYTASSLALAMLEVMVQSSDLATPQAAIQVTIPDDLVETPSFEMLPNGWRDDRLHAQEFGEEWFASRRSLALLIPSAIIPLEMNLLINPEHPDFSRLSVAPSISMDIDDRLIDRER